MALNFANAYETTLASGVTDSATAWTVANGDAGLWGTGSPAVTFRALITDGTNREIIAVTAKSGTNNTSWTVTREVENAAAWPKRAWSAGARIVALATAGALALLTDTSHTHDGTGVNGPQIAASGLASSAVTAAKIAAQPRAKGTRSATLSIPNNTETVVTLPTEEFDNDGIHSTSANTERLTAQTAGFYAVMGWIEWEPSTSGVRFARLRKNGGFVVTDRRLPASFGYSDLTMSMMVELAVNDYVDMVAFQDSGGALNIANASLSMVRIGA